MTGPGVETQRRSSGEAPIANADEPLLRVRGLRTQFDTEEGIVRAVNGVSFDLDRGETLGIVGESGCGKTVSVLSMLRLIPQPPGRIAAGEVWFEGRDLLKLDSEEIRSIRGNRIAMIFQDPMTSLNPVLSIGRQLGEPLWTHLGMEKDEAFERSVQLLELVSIPEARQRITEYPHQFSGGMRQRVMIAMALSCNPQLLIADEPTTALDVTIQAQIIDIVKQLRDEFNMAVIWITHDLGIVAGLADRVHVMYAGYIVEKALVDDFYLNPRHPYSLGLLGSLPRLDSATREKLVPIEGLPPDLTSLPPGCPYYPRCKYHQQQCIEENPTLHEVGSEHSVACWVDL